MLLVITTSDWIQIVGIIMTSLIGIWIGSTVQGNLTNNRALKEYYISEIKSINDDYSLFLKCLFKNEVTSKIAQEWFKVMNIRIETIQSSILNELDTMPEILANHITMKQFVTDTDEFDSCYKKDSLVLNPGTRNHVLELHKFLKNSIVKTIIDINRAKRKK
jgi:hypothetical protein